ncbi:MAG: ADP-dependent glucokinase/phosphofructokinase [Candidatus Aenigmatarchaeota archaeon]
MDTRKTQDLLKKLTLFVAYNTDVDEIYEINENFEKLFSKEEYEEARKRDPVSIEEKVDLLAGLLKSMKNNDAEELPIYNKKVHSFLKNNLKPQTERMGGQAGIMSNLLSILGCKVIVYTELLSNKQAEMFADNQRIFYPLANDILHFKRPQDCASRMKTKKNWIFEYKKGNKIFETEAKGNNRFVAASRPEEIKIEVGKLQKHAEALSKECDCAILSGFHDLKEDYKDGTTYLDHLKNSKKFIKRMKVGNPDLKIQIEFASTPDRQMRKDILKVIVPEANCLSMDRSEMISVLEILENNETEEIDSVEEYFEGLKNILQGTGIECVKIHTLHYFMTINNGYIEPEFIKKGLEFARKLAYIKAREGNVESIDSVNTVNDNDISQKGIRERERLSNYLGNNELTKKGLIKNTDYNLIMIPTKLVENPEETVGIGDVISSGSFALENALKKVKEDE